MRPALLLPVAAAVLLLAGCETFQEGSLYEGRYDWRQGWRKGEVVAFDTAAGLDRPGSPECVRRDPREQLATTMFAIVAYRDLAETHRRAVPLEPGSAMARGDPVYLNIVDCRTAPASR